MLKVCFTFLFEVVLARKKMNHRKEFKFLFMSFVAYRTYIKVSVEMFISLLQSLVITWEFSAFASIRALK